MGGRALGMSPRILEIGSSTKGAALIVASQYQAADFRVVFEPRKLFLQAGMKFSAPCVAGFGAAQGQDCNLSALFIKQRHQTILQIRSESHPCVQIRSESHPCVTGGLWPRGALQAGFPPIPCAP